MTLKGPSESRYKFRAKCEPDMFRYVAWVLAHQSRAQAENVNRLDDGSVTCELTTTLSLDHLRDLSRIGGDLYRIAETKHRGRSTPGVPRPWIHEMLREQFSP